MHLHCRALHVPLERPVIDLHAKGGEERKSLSLNPKTPNSKPLRVGGSGEGRRCCRSAQAGEWRAARARVQAALARRYRAASSADAGAAHDAVVTAAMHPLASEVVRACLPGGQRKPFPANCLGLMTVSGAKGSTVNFSQISALLGQQVQNPRS